MSSTLYVFPTLAVYTYLRVPTYTPVIRRVNTVAPPGKESRAICTGLFGYDIFTFAKGHGGLTLYGAIWKGTVASSCIIKRFSWSGAAGVGARGRRG